MPSASDNSPRIYVACLASYANSRLYGAWIAADQDPEDIQAQIDEMLAGSPASGAEEWAIHDYENFGPLRLSEHESIEDVSAVGKIIAEHGELGAALVDHFGGPSSVDEAEKALEESYQGAFDSLDDWAEQLAEDTGADAETYRSYIDWERVGRDAELGGDVFTLETSDGRVHVFWAH